MEGDRKESPHNLRALPSEIIGERLNLAQILPSGFTPFSSQSPDGDLHVTQNFTLLYRRLPVGIEHLASRILIFMS